MTMEGGGLPATPVIQGIIRTTMAVMVVLMGVTAETAAVVTAVAVIKRSMFFLEQLIELVSRIWDADTEIRDRSWFGESGLERDGRRFVAWLCGGAIALLAVGGAVWWWWSNRAH